MIRLAVFGKPIAQSLSPRIHSLFAQQCGLDIEYRAIEAGLETFPQRVAEFAALGSLGCNITAPLKRQAWELANRHSDNARRAGAVNTLVFRAAGDWYGDSTDGGGLVNDLGSLENYRLQGSRICLLGAGGAAAGVLAALLKAGPACTVIVNRTRQRAIRLRDHHTDLGTIEIAEPGEIETHEPFDLVINATSLGHHGEAPGFSPAWLRPGGAVYDMNYGPASHPLRSVCEKHDVKYSDGLGMLVGQAALSFEIWTGQTPSTADVLSQLRENL